MKKIIGLIFVIALVISVSACTHDNDSNGQSGGVLDTTLEQSEQPKDDTPTDPPGGITDNLNTESVLVWISDTPDVHGVFWLGMTMGEAAQAFEENGLEIGEHGIADDVLSTNNSQEVQNFIFGNGGKLEYISIMTRPHFIEDYTGNITLYTERGVRVGDTFEKVEELYGQPHRVENADDRRLVVYSYKLSDDGDYYLLFVANGLPDVVDAIIFNVNDDTSFQTD